MLLNLILLLKSFISVQEVQDESGQKCTPLIIAARNGHEKVVKVFLNKYPVDLEQEGSVKVDNYVVEGASALWCAAGKYSFRQSTFQTSLPQNDDEFCV